MVQKPDILCIECIADEINREASGFMVTSVQEQSPLCWVLLLKKENIRKCLLLSIDSRLYRAHLLSVRKKSQGEAGGRFINTLRNLLRDSVLIKCEPELYERILYFHFKTIYDFSPKTYTIVHELMGRNSNIIILDQSKNVVTYAKGSKSKAISSRLATGKKYQVVEIKPEAARTPGPILEKEAAFLASLNLTEIVLDNEKIKGSNSKILEFFKRRPYNPGFYLLNSQVKAYYPFPLQHLKSLEWNSTRLLSEAMEKYYEVVLDEQDEDSLRDSLSRNLNRKLKKLNEKRSKLEEDFRKAEEIEVYRKSGDLILQNLSNIKKGMEKITVKDKFSPQDNSKELTIPLLPNLTPVENAESYFKKFKKYKRGRAVIDKRLKACTQEISNIESLIKRISCVSASTFAELKELSKLIEGASKVSPAKVAASGSEKTETRSFLCFKTPDAWEIYVGKNAKENEMLTFKFSHPEDIWLHATGTTGSHVVIKRAGRRDMPSRKALEQAACIAAYYSRAKTSASVPVAWTLRKYVRKIKDAPAGAVTYSHEKTIFATPQLPPENNV